MGQELSNAEKDKIILLEGTVFFELEELVVEVEKGTTWSDGRRK